MNVLQTGLGLVIGTGVVSQLKLSTLLRTYAPSPLLETGLRRFPSFLVADCPWACFGYRNLAQTQLKPLPHVLPY
jgi:hypothetical protein